MGPCTLSYLNDQLYYTKKKKTRKTDIWILKKIRKLNMCNVQKKLELLLFYFSLNQLELLKEQFITHTKKVFYFGFDNEFL